MPTPSEPLSFQVRTRDGEHRARTVHEASFEAAAIAYLEAEHLDVADESEISVVVRELGSGHEHCFRLHLDTGEAEPCGTANESRD